LSFFEASWIETVSSFHHLATMNSPYGAIHERVARLRIDGQVQRTGFRGWAEARANERGLDGWVRDRGEGWIEILVAGSAGAVEDMIQLCREGPKAARVSGGAELEVDPDTPIWVGFHRMPAR
jgi:acylphosphatase